tara:strand:+ start:134 stop:235 length:102 start_codon:yes stop_codon:yes gene_type:complete
VVQVVAEVVDLIILLVVQVIPLQLVLLKEIVED